MYLSYISVDVKISFIGPQQRATVLRFDFYKFWFPTNIENDQENKNDRKTTNKSKRNERKIATISIEKEKKKKLMTFGALR